MTERDATAGVGGPSASGVPPRAVPHGGSFERGTLQMVAFSVVMSVTAQLLLRRGMAAIAPTQGIALLRAAAQSGWVLGGLVVFAFGTGMWLLVLSRLELSLAYPLGSLSFVLITLLSAILLRERVPLLRWVGTMVILGGILVVARGEQPHRLQTDSHSSPEGERKGPS